MPQTSHNVRFDSVSDTDLLVMAQAGDAMAGEILPWRIGGLGCLRGAERPGGLIGNLSSRVCRRASLFDVESQDEVAARIHAAICDPNVVRFDPHRGTVSNYLCGLALNAVKSVRSGYQAEQLEPIDDSRLPMSIEDRDFVCWVLRTAPIAVRRALARLYHGRTLEEAASAAGMSRRSLKRAIVCHLDQCKRILYATP